MAEDKEFQEQVIIEDADLSTDPENDNAADSASNPKKRKKDKKDDVGVLKQQLSDLNEKHLRTLAEFDNFRKRTQREKSAMHDDGVVAAAMKFLPVIDNFVLATRAADMENSIVKGFAMILKQMEDTLAALGFEPIESVGQAFDPNLHNAVMLVADSGYEAGVVAEELLRGYVYNGKPVRHSLVKVAE